MKDLCGVRQRFCHLCGREVQHARIYRREGDDGPSLVVCDECEARQPRCRHCQVPTVALLAQDDLCPACWASTPVCLACGQPVGREQLHVGEDGPYCMACYQNRPHCDVCGVPVGDPAWLLADGRQICDRCHQTAVYQPEQGREIFKRTVGIIQRELGLTLNVPTDFCLVDRDRIVALVRERNGNPGDGKTLGIFMRNGRQRGMYVEYGLPQILLIQVIAHEYAHAWHGENCPLLRDLLLTEGFAEWVAYKVLQTLGATKKTRIMEEREDLYGEGLRHMLGIEKAHGIACVLDYCRTARQGGVER